MLSRTTKLKLYNTLIVTVLIYGVDSDKRMLDMFERKVLWTIYGPVCVDGEWRTRYNHELHSLYKDDQVTKKIRVQRLRWLGHLARMNENVAKRVFERNPDGRRRRDRPKLRWKDSVLEDYQKLGVALAWRTAAFGPSSLERTNSLGERRLCFVVPPYVCMYVYKLVTLFYHRFSTLIFCHNVLLCSFWSTFSLISYPCRSQYYNIFHHSKELIRHKDITELIPSNDDHVTHVSDSHW